MPLNPYTTAVLLQNNKGLSLQEIAVNLGVDYDELVSMFASAFMLEYDDTAARISINATQNDLLWFAGLFDGSGNICIDNYGTKYTMHIEITCAKNYADLLIALIGGKITPTQYGTSYRWYANSRQAALILRVIHPLLKFKQSQAQIAIDFQDRLRQGSRLSSHELSIRKELKASLDALKSN